MGLRLHNTLTRTKEDFVPIDPANVRMYVCGPTVYDFAHIGNARPLIVFDVLFRLLRHLYGPEHVTYVRNITDVDDKINARAAEEYPDLPLNEAIRRVTEKTEKQFHEDAAALGCLPPTQEPRATEHIDDMKAMIEALVEKGYAYVAEDHVLFHVSAMKDYGRLSNRSLDDMIAGARVEIAPYKRDPMDFVLWKPSKPGEPSWPSPAGIAAPGRPGWHLECSAMSDRWLWEAAKPSLSAAGLARPHQFDIHGGGIDLLFPHHENEVAQSRCAHGTPVMANYWLHNGFLQVEGEKMSKSLGNFVTIRELLRGWVLGPWSGAEVRWAMLQTHYRQPLDWTVNVLRNARTELRKFQVMMNVFNGTAPWSFRDVETEDLPSEGVVDALADDLNTPLMVSRLRNAFSNAKNQTAWRQLARDLQLVGVIQPNDQFLGQVEVKAVNVPTNLMPTVHDLLRPYLVARANRDSELLDELRSQFADVNIGIDDDIESREVVLRYLGGQSDTDSVDALVAARAAARKAKNFAEADRIRAELEAMGVQLKDAKDPKTGELVTTWEVKR